ncbi:MAG: hypothetical protein OXG11_05160 [Chloroflexi bacterium]|nr:hypothetical protein [Chloroflexota bacterium]
MTITSNADGCLNDGGLVVDNGTVRDGSAALETPRRFDYAVAPACPHRISRRNWGNGRAMSAISYATYQQSLTGIADIACIVGQRSRG